MRIASPLFVSFGDVAKRKNRSHDIGRNGIGNRRRAVFDRVLFSVARDENSVIRQAEDNPLS